MDTAHLDDVKKSVRTYIVVFVSLMALTIITVAISYLHLSIGAAITVALIVAAAKASLVAMYFMHLVSERRAVYWTLALTGFFFVVLMILPMFADQNSTRIFQ